MSPPRFPLGVRICHVPDCPGAPGDGGFCPAHQSQLDARVAAHVQRETDVRDLADLVAYPGWARVEATGRYHMEVHPSADGWIWYVVSLGGDRVFGRRTPGPVLAELTRLSDIRGVDLDYDQARRAARDAREAVIAPASAACRAAELAAYYERDEAETRAHEDLDRRGVDVRLAWEDPEFCRAHREAYRVYDEKVAEARRVHRQVFDEAVRVWKEAEAEAERVWKARRAAE